MGDIMDKNKEEKYQRKIIDNINQRKEYKDQIFNGKKSTFDEYSGEKIYYGNSKSALRKHKISRTTDVDHVTPLHKIQENKLASGLSDETIRKIANDPKNLRLTNSSRNRSKGDKTNIEYLHKQWQNGRPENIKTTYTMTKAQVQSEAFIQSHLATEQVKQKMNSKIDAIGNDIDVSGLVPSVMTTTIVNSIYHLTDAAMNGKDYSEAMKESIKDTSKSAFSYVAIQKGMPINKIISIAAIGDIFLKYIDGECTESECCAQILSTGLGNFVYGMTLIGGPVVATMASIATTVMCQAVIGLQARLKEENRLTQQRLSRIHAVANAALETMEEQREKLKTVIETTYSEWNTTFEKAFLEIFEGGVQYDFEKLSRGLDKILKVFDENIMFQTKEEFDDFFFDDNSILTL